MLITALRKNFVYEPCHGTGMIEVEASWMETISDYPPLEENMTFQVDTFISGDGFGIRSEKGVSITKDGCHSMTDYFKKGIIEIDGDVSKNSLNIERQLDLLLLKPFVKLHNDDIEKLKNEL